jgi:hypothetical protein
MTYTVSPHIFTNVTIDLGMAIHPQCGGLQGLRPGNDIMILNKMKMAAP